MYARQYVYPPRCCGRRISFTPDRRIPGEQNGQKIAVLAADDCYRRKKCLHINRDTEKMEGGLRGTM